MKTYINLLMRKSIFIVLILSLLSCKSTLEKKYNEASIEKDLIEVSKQISSQELQLLKEYIPELKETYGNGGLSLFSYQELLNMAKSLKDAKESRRQKEEEKQKIIQKKTELLCNKKWKTIQHDFILSDLLNESGDSVSVFSVNKKVLNSMADMKQKIYLSDGTYKVLVRNKETSAGTWEFADINQIIETRPEESLHLSSNVKIRGMKEPTYILDILQMDNDTLCFTEKRSESNTEGVITYIVMVSK